MTIQFRASWPCAVHRTWLTHIYIYIYICPDILLTLNTQQQKAFSFLLTVASFKEQQGEILNHLFFSRTKEVPLQRSMSAGCQNDTQLKQGNKTSNASWIWDGGYKWVNPDYSLNECGILLVQTLQLCFLYTKSNLNISYYICTLFIIQSAV